MTNWRSLIGKAVRVENSAGTQYEGVLKAITPTGIVITVIATKRRDVDGRNGYWVFGKKKKETVHVKDAKLLEVEMQLELEERG